MTPSPDIIGVVKELQRSLQILAPREGFNDRRPELHSKIVAAFPAIATALIALDGNQKSMEQTTAAILKKLVIAVEALKEARLMSSWDNTPAKEQKTLLVIDLALARIRSLT